MIKKVSRYYIKWVILDRLARSGKLKMCKELVRQVKGEGRLPISISHGEKKEVFASGSGETHMVVCEAIYVGRRAIKDIVKMSKLKRGEKGTIKQKGEVE